MQINAERVEDYLTGLTPERAAALKKVLAVIR